VNKHTGLLAAVVVVGVLLSGCGKGNIFSWAHSAGDTKNLDSMSSDASTALQAKDYAKALDYYTKLLAADPNNAEAIYGYAVAELANSGLDVGDLIANLIKQQSAPEYQHLAPVMGTLGAQYSVSSASNLLPQSIIDRIIILSAAVNAVLDPSKLPKIVLGKADSRISPTNTDVNINVAFCLLLRAAMTVQQSNVITFDTDYHATISPSATHDQVNSVARSALQDIASANARFNVVVSTLKLKNDNAIVNIQTDLVSLFNDAKTKLAAPQYKVSCADIDVNTNYLQ
jgi:outer membrane murein-binding lipoprotein Lpp